MELADTSVWAHKDHPQIRDWFERALERGDIAYCDPIALELLHSARNPAEFDFIEDRLLGLPRIAMETGTWDSARSTYRALGSRPGAEQRSVSHTDLLIAAAAQQAGIMLVHYDADYETIGRVTGQPTRWVAPRGSL